MTLQSGTRLGPYEIVAPLGEGGMGEVYRARDPRFGRDVAVKVLSSSLAGDGDRLRRFEQEAKAAGALNHPNILVVHDFGTVDGTPYLVSELLVGRTLRDELRDQGASRPLPPRKAVDYGLQIARGLAAAHDLGIVHRDLKPENVFALDDGRVKILDFGLAKLRQPPPLGPQTDVRTQATTETGSGLVLGTVGYMAPEQVRAETVDHRADIFALGVILFEMLTGRRAFVGDSAVETMNAILKEDPPDFATLGLSIPGELERIVRHCLEKRPSDRFQSARDLAFHLAGLSEASGTRSTPGTAGRTWRSRGSREVVAWSVAALASVAALGLALKSESVSVEDPQGPVYSFINAPDEAVSAFVRGFALSPDGEYLAFPARDQRGRTLLWMRTMSSGEAKPIAGTRDAAFPFWSPDGREVAFWSDRKIKRVAPVGTTPPQTICDSSASYSIFRGGVWLADGTIVFAENSGPARKCTPGGQPTSVFDLTEGMTRILWPSVLAGGRTFLIGVEHKDSARQGVYRMELDRPLPPAPVLPGLTQSALAARALPPNHIVWRQGAPGTALVARPFDGMHLETGPEVVVAPSAGGSLGGAGFDASTNGRFVHQPFTGNDSVSRAHTYWFTRSGARLSYLDVETQSSYRLAPDDSRVAMQRDDDIWVADLRRGVRTRVTTTPEFETSPMWSADGQRMMFRHVGVATDLFVHDFATGRTDTIVGGPRGSFIGADWSSDGRTVVASIVSNGLPASLDLVLFDLASKTTTPFLSSPFNEVHPRFSPDGHLVAYALDETGDREIYVRPIGPGVAKRVSLNGGDFPMWRRDGKELVFVAPDGTFMSVPAQTGSGWSLGDPVALFKTSPLRDGGDFYRFDMTGDGQRFLVQLEPERPPALVLVQNWTALLRKK